MDLGEWLRNLGLERYTDAFSENEIDAGVLSTLTNEDLKDLGISIVGHRRRILDAITALNDGQAPTSAPSTVPDRVGDKSVGEATLSKAPDAERRQLTVMFIDLVGSTELSRRLDPEDMRDVIHRYQNTVAGEIVRFEGHVAKFMGDGVLAYFGYPVAHEDDAERAVRAGLAVNNTIGNIKTPHGENLAARIGVATGLVVVGDLVGEGASEERVVIGETPNLAARLQTLASEGSIVISESTAHLLGGIFDLTILGMQSLKGFPEGVQAYRVIGEGAAESRFDALHETGTNPLIGREQEIGLLLQRWSLATGGEGQVVQLLGEPGIGKSHVVQALRQRVSQEQHTRFRFHCSPYHTNSALYPIIDQLTRAAKFERTDSPDKLLDKLEQLLARPDRDSTKDVPAIAALLSVPTGDRYSPLDLSPQRQKSLVFEVLIGQLESIVAENPVLTILEDIQWIDPTSLEYFDAIVQRTEHLPMFLVTTCRPGTAARWTRYPHVALLTLNRLGRTDALTIINDLTGGRGLPEEVLEHILLRTDGVPLFVEELTKVVLESDMLSADNGQLTLCGPLPPVAIPATLQDSLMARLDRLAPVKEVAQIGAVIGRSFSFELIAAVAGMQENKLTESLDQLVDSELVFRRGVAPNATYTFKHALVQDTAYQTLLKTTLRTLHARIADVLEKQFPKLTQTQPEVIAQHLTKAGLVDKAVEFWIIAGQVAMTRSATPEAIAHLDSGLHVLMNLAESNERDRQELCIQLARGSAMVAAHGFASSETGGAYKRARELCERLDDVPQLFAVVYGLCLFHLYAGDLDAAQAASNKLLEYAKRSNNQDLLFFANRAAGVSSYPAGKFSVARDHLERALSLYDAERHRSPAFVYAFDPRVVCLDYLARSLFPMGLVGKAIECNNEAILEARRIGHRNSLALPLFFGGTLHQLCGDIDTVREHAEELTILAEQERFKFWRAGGSILSGWVEIVQGGPDGGMRRIQAGVEQWQATGAEFMMTYFLPLIAVAQINAGKVQCALSLLENSIQRIERSGERWFEAEVYRIRGEAFLALDLPEQASAEHSFQRALEIAHGQGARLWELKAATSLGRLWTDLGRQIDVPDLLNPILAGFSDPLPTPDRAAAKHVLAAATATS
ncbi:MAG: adenylate/guanylate cyclase domain-containing protein [Rhizobiaceae bacterium]